MCVFFAMATPAMMTKTMKLISEVFSSGESWLTVDPNAEDAVTAAPSSTGGFHSVRNGVPDEIRYLLEDQLLQTLVKKVRAEQHSPEVYRIVYHLSAPLIAFRNAPGETCIREAIVLLLLSTIF